MKELIRVAVLFVWFTHWNCQFACGQEAESTVTNLVVWELVAAAEPKPALQHSFWPALEKYKRGNAIVNYQRAYMHLSAEDITELRTILEEDDGFDEDRAKRTRGSK